MHIIMHINLNCKNKNTCKINRVCMSWKKLWQTIKYSDEANDVENFDKSTGCSWSSAISCTYS